MGSRARTRSPWAWAVGIGPLALIACATAVEIDNVSTGLTADADADGDGVADSADKCPGIDDSVCHGDCRSGSCVCDSGWAGASCDTCDTGHFGPQCTACNCVNGACNEGLTGDGTCLMCSPGFTGVGCTECAPGRFGAACSPCTCVNGVCDEGSAGSGECLSCEDGWLGANCDEEDNLAHDGAYTVSADTNFSFVNHPGRDCSDGGDMVRYPVASLTANTATLGVAPDVGCLNPNDEVLLINLQGRPTLTANTGNYEFLRVDTVVDQTVTFKTDKTKFYGGVADSDASVGLTPTQQKVVLQRVPNYESLTIGVGARAYADPWDGQSGGVFALRSVGTVSIAGSVDMSGAGYAGAIANSVANSAGVSGESYAGPGTLGAVANLGGGAGGPGDPGQGMACPDNGLSAGGGGYGTVGGLGGVGGGCDAPGGAVYGGAALTKIFLGSGGGSGGTDNTLLNNPPGGAGGHGGGIVIIMAMTLELRGTVTVAGEAGQGDVAGFECTRDMMALTTDSCWDFSGAGGGGSGGSILLQAETKTGTGQALVTGGLGGNANDADTGDGGDGGNGRIVQP